MQALTKDQKDELAAAEKVLAWLESGKDIRFGDWTAFEIDWLNTVQASAQLARNTERGLPSLCLCLCLCLGTEGIRQREALTCCCPPSAAAPARLQFLTAKPVVYLVNLSEKDYARKKNKWLPKLFEWVQAHGGDPLIPFSGALEAKLLDMPDDEKEVYCKEVGRCTACQMESLRALCRCCAAHLWTLPRPALPEEHAPWSAGLPRCLHPSAAAAAAADLCRNACCFTPPPPPPLLLPPQNALASALPKIVTAGFKAVQLIYYFTAGVVEVRCWQIRKGTKAPAAAGAIHSDFERGFIMGEIMSFADMHELGSEAGAPWADRHRVDGFTGGIMGESMRTFTGWVASGWDARALQWGWDGMGWFEGGLAGLQAGLGWQRWWMVGSRASDRGAPTGAWPPARPLLLGARSGQGGRQVEARGQAVRHPGRRHLQLVSGGLAAGIGAGIGHMGSRLPLREHLAASVRGLACAV